MSNALWLQAAPGCPIPQFDPSLGSPSGANLLDLRERSGQRGTDTFSGRDQQFQTFHAAPSGNRDEPMLVIMWLVARQTNLEPMPGGPSPERAEKSSKISLQALRPVSRPTGRRTCGHFASATS